MPSKDQEFTLSFPLDLGMDDTALSSAIVPYGDAPRLATSQNTRLSVRRGAPTKAPGSAAITDATTRSGDAACGGVIPCGNFSSSLVARRSRYGSQRIAGQTVVGASQTRNYWPADVSDAGVLPGSLSAKQAAICILNGQLWSARVTTDAFSGLSYIESSVIGASGEIVALPLAIYVLGVSASQTWVGLTAHGANGIRLWYNEGPALKVRTLTVVAGVVTMGSATTVSTAAGTGGPGTWDCCAQNDTYAWVAMLDFTLATGVQMVKVDVTTNNLALTNVYAGVGTGTTSKLAISVQTMSDATYVAVVASLVAGTSTLLLGKDDGTPVHTITGQMTYGEPLCAFLRVGTFECVVYGCSETVGAITTSFSDTLALRLQFRALSAAGTLGQELVIPWIRSASRMAMFSPASGEIYPVFCAAPCWNQANSSDPTSKMYLSDPAHSLYIVETQGTVTMIGRFGVDKADEAIHPLLSSTQGLFQSQSIVVSSNEIALTYLAQAEDDAEGSTVGFVSRYVRVDMSSRQPRYAIGPDGVTLIAGALPAYWDGVEAVELCPVQRPKVAVNPAGGAGANIAAGNYLVSAVVQWRDAAGTLHRSPPAEIVTMVSTGATPWQVSVSKLPIAVKSDVQVLVYCSQAGGTVLYAQTWAITSGDSFSRTYGNISTVDAFTQNPAMYTDTAPSSPLAAQQPDAWWDVAIVGNRAWSISAENRRRLRYSKPKEQGVTYEWDSEMEIELPPSALKAQAVVEVVAGSVGVLCEAGVWVITGSGPDNTLDNPEAFNPPEQLSDIACSSRDSVIRTPVGVMFISNGRFAVMDGGGARIVQDTDAWEIGGDFIVHPVLLRDTQEVIWLSGHGEHVVYNYSLDRWTRWTYDVVGDPVACSRDPVTGLVNVITSSAVQQLDPAHDSYSSVAQMTLQTGYFPLGGPEDDNAIEGVYIRCQRNASHGLQVILESEFGRDTKTATFSAAKLLACTVGEDYTICVSPPTPSMRSLRITLVETDATTDACRPLAVTVVGVKNRAPMRSSVPAQGRM